MLPDSIELEGQEKLPKVDIDKPRWDQNTYSGRAKYFFTTTNPLNLLLRNSELDEAKTLVEKYRAGVPLPGYSILDIYKAKERVDSAFHSETGEKMVMIGRMSAQVPMNMLITGCMMTFYRSTPAVFFWQWINQSFNAVVNYSNRSGNTSIPVEQLGKSYVMATGGAVITALGLNKVLKGAPKLLGRFVPFTAVAAANCINIPLMRNEELRDGISVYDDQNNFIGESRYAAKLAIAAVVLSRILMCAPGMVLTPIVVEIADQKRILCKYPWINLPMQLAVCGLCLTFATPLCCAIFPQKSSTYVSNLEFELQEKVKVMELPPEKVYFNKGL